jgi:DNA-binding MarR family transcriptional regulator
VDEVAQQLLSRAALLLRLLARQVRSGEITRTELDVLSILGERSLRITELAERAGLAQPTMTLLVRRLEQRGWVARERLPADGRVAMIVITSAGQAAWESFRARALRAMRDDLRELSDEQLRELAAAAATLSWFVGDLQRSSSGSPPEA